MGTAGLRGAWCTALGAHHTLCLEVPPSLPPRQQVCSGFTCWSSRGPWPGEHGHLGKHGSSTAVGTTEVGSSGGQPAGGDSHVSGRPAGVTAGDWGGWSWQWEWLCSSPLDPRASSSLGQGRWPSQGPPDPHPGPSPQEAAWSHQQQAAHLLGKVPAQTEAAVQGLTHTQGPVLHHVAQVLGPGLPTRPRLLPCSAQAPSAVSPPSVPGSVCPPATF